MTSRWKTVAGNVITAVVGLTVLWLIIRRDVIDYDEWIVLDACGGHADPYDWKVWD